MIERIHNRYSFNEDEVNIIKHNASSHNDWDKNCFYDIKNQLIEFLRDEQGNCCCYCKDELGFKKGEFHIEHILPKSKYHTFMFKSENLALACPHCNISKSTNDPYIPYNNSTNQICRYPLVSNRFLMIHPYFDNYSDSIKILKGSIYNGLSPKGIKTIEFCKLYELQFVEKQIKKFKSSRTNIRKKVFDLINGKKLTASFIKNFIKTNIN